MVFYDVSSLGFLHTLLSIQRKSYSPASNTLHVVLVHGASLRSQTFRRWIFKKGWALTSKKFRALDIKSLIPTRSAFSTRLSQFGFNFYSMFVPDLMHEFELGVWKAIFIHLLCILYAAGGDKIQEFNKRFRKVPTFGRDTIRHFSANVSAMKKLAARDFEDILQCIIPVMEGLLPKRHDKIIADLLFELANWHAHAKLRIHTDSTLKSFEKVTTSLAAAGPDIPFGFVSPDEVLRGTHLIPAFAHGKTSKLLPQSIACQESEQNEDWKYHYVNIFVDRDMFMRYLGGGVGHKGAGASQYRMHKENEHCNGQDRGDEDGESQGEYANEEEEGDKVDVDDEDEEDTDGENDDGKEEEEEEEDDDDDDDNEVGEEEGDEEDNIVDLGPEDGEDGNIVGGFGMTLLGNPEHPGSRAIFPDILFSIEGYSSYENYVACSGLVYWCSI
ncbi:hypothetical protein SCP_0106040 [Sparassis crispa]|uniref:Uncharacterized protein n=1 Tax=Sparassis crispa TaxID=139825 RepID=A0A401G6C9_9APHY|nr:hypothetical protein SCP_0106040 [Sparassis crispa]GBE77722.1 hypothetical protein SCP_0106040 [Sparassis crispa]